MCFWGYKGCIINRSPSGPSSGIYFYYYLPIIFLKSIFGSLGSGCLGFNINTSPLLGSSDCYIYYLPIIFPKLKEGMVGLGFSGWRIKLSPKTSPSYWTIGSISPFYCILPISNPGYSLSIALYVISY